MAVNFAFRHLEPFFFAGLFDDPILLLRINPTGRVLMFDCGQIHHLAKRIFSRLDAIFISHAHMDHWMGIDSVIRHLIVADRTIDIFGPLNLADKLEAKLKGYDWNLTEDYWCNCRVHEITDDQLTSWLFVGEKGFERQEDRQLRRTDKVIYQTPYCRVKAEICRHDISSIAYRVEEKPAFLIDRNRLTQLGLKPGPWLAKLKKLYFSSEAHPADNQQADSHLGKLSVPDLLQDPRLITSILHTQEATSLGYISDIDFSPDNLAKLTPFMSALHLLISECTYLSAHRHRARAANHLCTDDVNQLLNQIRPDFFLPMHLSKTYRKASENLYRELSPPGTTQVIALPDFLTPQPLRTDETSLNILNK